MSRWELLTCPRCATPDPKPIHYGLPDDEGLRMAQQGIVELGGCEAWDGVPLWQCWACGERWGELRRDCWPPDLVAPVDAITIAQVIELLEDEGWEQGFAIRESGDVEPTCESRFHKAGSKAIVRLRTGLDSDEIEVWIDGPDPQGDHDRVYSLLEKLGFVNPTRTRPCAAAKETAAEPAWARIRRRACRSWDDYRMSEPADNPYQSPRGAEPLSPQAGRSKEPRWLEGLMVILGAGLEFLGFVLLLGVATFLASVGVRSVGVGWTVLGFVALAISPVLLRLIVAMVIGLIGEVRKPPSQDHR